MATNKLYFVDSNGAITEVVQTRGGVLIEVADGKIILANVYNNQDHSITILEEQKVVPVETVDSIIHPQNQQQTGSIASRIGQQK